MFLFYKTNKSVFVCKICVFRVLKDLEIFLYEKAAILLKNLNGERYMNKALIHK